MCIKSVGIFFFFFFFEVHKICSYVHTKNVQINNFHTNNIASLRVSLQDALDLDVMLVDLGGKIIAPKHKPIN